MTFDRCPSREGKDSEALSKAMCLHARQEQVGSPTKTRSITSTSSLCPRRTENNESPHDRGMATKFKRKRAEAQPSDNQHELVRSIEALHALLGDLDAYLDAAHRVLPEIGRVETEDGRRMLDHAYRYLDDAHALGRRAVADAKRLAEMAIKSERAPR